MLGMMTICEAQTRQSVHFLTSQEFQHLPFLIYQIETANIWIMYFNK